MARVAINGLGRIGRATLKSLEGIPELELVAVNDLVDADNLAYLIKYDTVYGRHPKKVASEDGHLVVGDERYRLFAEKDPSRLPWKDLGVDVVFECTGVFTKSDGLHKHLDAGAGRVVLSAPAKSDDVPMVVFGVNMPDKDLTMLSCASCTTNCIAPVAEVMDRRVGVEKATMTTVHAYTASQAIVDGPSKKWRRGRAGAANLVPTSTGAAKAATVVLPQLAGRFDGMAVRAPVPTGSLSDIIFVTKRNTTTDEIADIFREEAGSSRYNGILGTTDEKLVSSDIVADSRASVVDLGMTFVVADNLVKIVAFYDNEWGYTQQMVRTARYLVAG